MNDVGSVASTGSNTTLARGPISYFASNRVAANLIMLVLLVGGIYLGSRLAVQGFPDFDERTVTVRVPAPGSSPEEIEEDINRRIEESIIGSSGVVRVVSTASEGVALVKVEVSPYANPRTILADVEAAIDSIELFPPASAEPPQISLEESTRDVMTLAVSSSVLSESALRLVAEQLRDDVLALPQVSLVDMYGVRDREISIELSEEALRRNGLSIAEVTNAARRASTNLTAGELRTDAGGVILQSIAKRVVGDEFRNVPLITKLDGSIVTLGEVAHIRDGFVDEQLRLHVDGVPSVLIAITGTEDQSITKIANIVKEGLEGYPVPQDVAISIWDDASEPATAIFVTLVKNAVMGVLLVFVCLVLMFDLRFAVWIGVGIPLAFIGSLIFFNAADFTINTLTIFTLFMLVGIVVDDAVVVGENIAAERERGKGGLEAAIAGARGVVGPICVGLLTTLVAFIPFLFFPSGPLAMLYVIPIVVLFVLAVSLIESFYILPSHLSHDRAWSESPLREFQQRVDARMKEFANDIVVPTIAWVVRHTYITIAGGIGVFALAILLLMSDVVRVFLFERSSAYSAHIQANIYMPEGTPFDATVAATEKFVSAGNLLNEQFEGTTVSSVTVMAGNFFPSPSQRRISGKILNRSHIASVRLNLHPRPEREISPLQVISAWQQNVGVVGEAAKVEYIRGGFEQGAGLAYALQHDDHQVLIEVAEAFKSYLQTIDGVYFITDNLTLGKRHFDIELTKAGYAAGLTPLDIASQLRANFHGSEVQRIQRNRDEISVVVRYPPDRRRSLSELATERIQRRGGGEIPLLSVARIVESRQLAERTRIDGKRAAFVSALTDLDVITNSQGRELIEENLLPQLRAKFPRLKVSVESFGRLEIELFERLAVLLPIVFIVMYALMAGFLRSYWKPIVAIAGIPMAFSGAVFAHALLGWDFSAISLFGVIGVSGIVVNDALVLLDRYNKIRLENAQLPAIAAVSAAARHRFRAVAITTFTTLLGLSPLLFERSDDLLFLVPLVVSMFGGLLISTLFTLVFLPTLVMVVEGRKEVAPT